MLVRELIEKLQQMDQDVLVKVYVGYDSKYGAMWNLSSSVEQESVGWDDYLLKPIFEVFIE